MQKISNVTVLGTGVLGSQIAFQAAWYGYAVTAFDLDESLLGAARERFTKLAAIYTADGVGGGGERRGERVLAGIHYSHDLAEAVADADLVIEAVPETLSIKQQTYTDLAAVAPAKTIFATNSSTLLPSDLKESTGRPDRFLALHYANNVWRQNTAEVMGTTDTDPAVFDAVVAFTEGSGLVPIRLKKEKAGSVLNSMLVPLLNAAAGLLVGGFADAETIDKTWRIGTGAPVGPFQIFDIIGLTTPYNIAVASSDAGSQAFAAYLKENFIDAGKLGVATGEGFYRY